MDNKKNQNQDHRFPNHQDFQKFQKQNQENHQKLAIIKIKIYL